jgi:two-component system response regulator HydG
LKNVLERALVMCEGGLIDVKHLALGVRPAPENNDVATVGGVIRVPSVGRSLASVESELVEMTLRLTEGNKSAAARILGISRPTLHRKISVYGLRAPASVS